MNYYTTQDFFLGFLMSFVVSSSSCVALLSSKETRFSKNSEMKVVLELQTFGNRSFFKYLAV